MLLRVLLAIVLPGLLVGPLGTPPAFAGVGPLGATTHVRAAQPGETYRGTIVVRNTDAEPAEVKVYRRDYAFTADGRNEFGAPGGLPRSNAGWLRLSQEQITVPPKGRSTVQYEVSVPDDPDLAGTYWSTIMVEPVTGAEAADPRGEGVRLVQVVRHAVQVITEIGDTGTAAIEFKNARVLSGNGERLFTVDVENTGERWLRPKVWLELHDPQGRSAGRLEGQRRRIFPATSVRYRIDLSGVRPGKYLALLVADAGRNDFFGTRLELNIP